MAKRRSTFKLEDDEMVVVGRLEDWRHLVMVYETLSSQAANPHDANTWMQYGAWIREWISKAEKDMKEFKEWE